MVVIQTIFEKAARAQARILGAPSLNMLIITPKSVNIPDAEVAAEEAAKAGVAAQQFPAMIEQPH